MRTIAGLATARGFAVGPAFIYRGDGEIPIPQYVVKPGREADELLRAAAQRADPIFCARTTQEKREKERKSADSSIYP